jgi:hypothetical protein
MATGCATAIDAWDKRWATEEGRADWLDPEPDVVALLPELKARGVRGALDLGCGVGRHALFLAEQGLMVEAIDGQRRRSQGHASDGASPRRFTGFETSDGRCAAVR